MDKGKTGVNYRLEELTVLGAKQNSELAHIKETTDEIKELVKEQNGRVRWLEQQTTAIKAIGVPLAVVFSGFIGWLFNTR